MSKQPLLKVSTTELGENKSFPFSVEDEGWVTSAYTGEQLKEHIYAGNTSNPCLFIGGKRGSEFATGGNTVYIDMDDGVTFDEIIALPIVQNYAVLVLHSASSGCFSNKPGVDGRERLRIIFALEVEVDTNRFTEDLGSLHSNVKIHHLMRCALNDYFANQLCEQLGIPKLKDNSHKSISQLFFGNSGEGIISTEYGDYQCSTDRRFWIGNGFLPKEDMQKITEAYEKSRAESLALFTGRSEEERSKDALIAEWIFDNEILDERVYVEDRNTWLSVIHAAKSIDEDLLDVVLKSGERFNDHRWRTDESTMRCFKDGYSNSRMTLGTIIHWANICCPEWRSLCPHTGGTVNPPPPLSAGMYLLKGIPVTSIII